MFCIFLYQMHLPTANFHKKYCYWHTFICNFFMSQHKLLVQRYAHWGMLKCLSFIIWKKIEWSFSNIFALLIKNITVFWLQRAKIIWIAPGVIINYKGASTLLEQREANVILWTDIRIHLWFMVPARANIIILNRDDDYDIPITSTSSCIHMAKEGKRREYNALVVKGC